MLQRVTMRSVAGGSGRVCSNHLNGRGGFSLSKVLSGMIKLASRYSVGKCVGTNGVNGSWYLSKSFMLSLPDNGIPTGVQNLRSGFGKDLPFSFENE